MKKFITALLIFLVSLAPLFANESTTTPTSYETVQTKELMLQGAYRSVLDVAVEAIPAQSTSFMQGMPFNIENSLTWYGVAEYGREIANWHFIANGPFRIDVIAEDLRIESTNAYYETANTLSYRLTFTCTPSFVYVDSSTGRSVEQNSILYTFTADSLAPSALTSNPDAISGSWQLFNGSDGSVGEGFQYSTGTYVGSSAGSIFFQFTENSTGIIERDYAEDTERVPSGDWSGKVTLNMVAI